MQRACDADESNILFRCVLDQQIQLVSLPVDDLYKRMSKSFTRTGLADVREKGLSSANVAVTTSSGAVEVSSRTLESCQYMENARVSCTNVRANAAATSPLTANRYENLIASVGILVLAAETCSGFEFPSDHVDMQTNTNIHP